MWWGKEFGREDRDCGRLQGGRREQEGMQWLIKVKEKEESRFICMVASTGMGNIWILGGGAWER